MRLFARLKWAPLRNGSSAIAACVSATPSSIRPEYGHQAAQILRHAWILRREFESAAVFPFGAGEIVIDVLQDPAFCQMRLREILVQTERALRRGPSFCDRLLSFFQRNTAVDAGQIPRRDRQLGIGQRVTRVESDRLFVVADRFAGILLGAALAVEIPLQEGVVGLDVVVRRRGRGGQLCALPVVPQERDLELFRDRPGYLRLQREDVLQFPVVGFRPDIGPIGRFDQRHRDAHPLGRFTHAPFEQIIHAELFANRLAVLASCL